MQAELAQLPREGWTRRSSCASTVWSGGVGLSEHPSVPLTWLANEPLRAGIGLKGGAFVGTGTLTGMLLARAGEEHVADYGPFGSVCVVSGEVRSAQRPALAATTPAQV